VHGVFGSDVVTDSRFGDNENIDGHQMTYSPHFTGNFGVQYAFDLGNGATLTPRVDYAYVDAQTTSIFAVSGLDGLESRSIVNALLTYAMEDGWMFQAYATNLNNDHYVAGYSAGAITSNDLRNAGPPRQFGLRVMKSF